ncbi:MAG: phosphonoacetaldehyde reductase [Patescibacteria group bacterium]
MEKQVEYFGNGSIKKLEEVLSNLKSERIFLVTGKNSFKESGAEKELESIFQGKNVFQFSDFKSNPNIIDVKKGIEEFKKFAPDIVVAVGGGSVIDMAKLVNMLSFQVGDLEDYIKGEKKLTTNGLPLVAIPTTSGSGSEATHFAVVYIDTTKYSLADQKILPTISIVDPLLTSNLNAEITAQAGADALCQAIESLWSVASTKESKEYAREALSLLYPNLKDVVLKPDQKLREIIAKGSHLAGKAINLSKTTACHALSYPFTSHFNIPHGQAVSLTLPQILIYNSEVNEENNNDPRGVSYVKQTIDEIIEILGTKTPKEASETLDELFNAIGLKVNFDKLKPVNIDLILKEASIERMKNNPRNMTLADARLILNTII